MTESTQVTLLRRMIAPQEQEAVANPLTSSRAVRLALTKAASDTVGLVLTVESVGEEVTRLDDMLGSLSDDLMLVALQRDDMLVGLVALDMEMRAAVLEMETMGAVLAHAAEVRAPTRTDKMLCDPLLTAFLFAFPSAVAGTALDGWMDGVTHTDRIESKRAAGLLLPDGDYRIVRLRVDLGVAERQAELSLCLPVVQPKPAAEVAPAPRIDWDSKLDENINTAPARLDALLHRFPISLATAQALQVGTLLPLPGCTVNSVRLIAPDGKDVAQAKLGQMGGYRAVRIEPAPAPQLSELAGAATEPPMPLPDMLEVGGEQIAPELADDLPPLMAEPADEFVGDLEANNLPELPAVPLDPETL